MVTTSEPGPPPAGGASTRKALGVLAILLGMIAIVL